MGARMKALEQTKALQQRQREVTINILMGKGSQELEGLLADIKADIKALELFVRAEREAGGEVTPHDRMLRAIFGGDIK